MASIALASLRDSFALSYIVQKWNARRKLSTSVLLPTSSLFEQAQFKWLCKCNVSGQWFNCKQISIYFYNSGFWRSASVPYWFRVTFSVRLFACHGYVPSMYITKFICESTNQYVPAGVTTVFRGMMNSPSDQMLQDTFHRYTRAYLSVLFQKILCWPVG